MGGRPPSWDRFMADCARARSDEFVSRYWWLTERSFLTVASFRIGGTIREALPAPIAKPILSLYRLLVLVVIEALTGAELPLGADIGPGLRIYHGQGLVVSSDVAIGANCTLRQGVNIGKVLSSDKSPRLGDDVDCGAYAQILGGVAIGDRAKIGPHAVVLRDVPSDATAFGVPARIMPHTAAE